MSRERMVTRTIEMTSVVYTFVNLETKEVGSDLESFFSVKKGITEAELIAMIKETCEPGVVPVAVESTEVMEVIFGMTEKEFIRNAQVIER